MRYGVFFLFLIYLNPANAIDSLKLQLQLQELEMASDTQRLRLLTELSLRLAESDNTKAKALVDEGITLAEQLGDSIGYYNLYSNLGVILFYQSKYDEGIRNISRSLEFFQQTDNQLKEAKVLYRLGSLISATGDYSKTDSLLSASSIICKELKNERELINVMRRKGNNFYYWKKYSEARQVFKEALELCKKNGMVESLAYAKLLSNIGVIEEKQDNRSEALDYYMQAVALEYNDEPYNANLFLNLGNIYFGLSEADKAMEYYKKGLAIRRKIGPPSDIAISLNNVGIAYRLMLNYGEALKRFEQAMKIVTKLESNGTKKRLLGLLTGNIGHAYMHLHRYEEAETYLKQYLKIKEETKDTMGISRAYRHLGETYRRSGQFQKGVDFGLKSLVLSERIKSPSISELASKCIADSYASLGNFKQAYIYSNKYWELNDTLFGAESTNKIRALEIKYETAKKENELKFEKEQVKNLEYKGKIDQLKIGLLVLGCSMLTLIIGMLIYFHRQRNRRLIQHKEQAELKVENITQENILLEQKNSEQQIQLNDYLKQLLKKSEQLQSLKNTDRQISKEEKENFIDSNIHEFLNANLQSEEGLKQFKYYFTMVHKDFFKNLNITYPKLTNNDLTLAALIKLNLNNKEVAQILNIIPSSVKTSRQRLYQKMNLADNEALRNYIIQL